MKFKKFRIDNFLLLFIFFAVLAFLSFSASLNGLFTVLRFPTHILCYIIKSCNLKPYFEILINCFIYSLIFERVIALRKGAATQKLIKYLFDHRYLISFFIVLAIMCGGIYLYTQKHWGFKDVAQVCTGFFIVITLFFTALNYEFSTSKMKQDYKSAKELLTYNTATEWHKSPLTEYQKTSISYEKKFIATNAVRTSKDFDLYISDPSNLDFRESLKGLLNSFETLAIGVHKELIDNDFMKEFYSLIFEIYYIDYYFFIESERIKKSNSKIWIQFTNLAEEWHPELNNNLQKGAVKSTIIT
ncbi:MAG: hypothetical protein JWO92_1221 [Chitinophagaceae bacterium]|nr:hypothetical protein [Chitinophagaceae bacterium]